MLQTRILWITIIGTLAASNSPNVLFITIDDFRPEINSYGSDHMITPNLDVLAEHGMQFNQAYIQQAICGPSRTSFLTSRRPDTTNIYGFGEYFRTHSGNFTTLPQYFKEHGYHTESIGKIFHPGTSSGGTEDYPYSWSNVPYVPPSFGEANSDWECYEPGPWQGEKLSTCQVDMDNYPWGKLPDQQSADRAIDFLQNVTSDDVTTPFFLALGFYKPHLPFKAPKEYFDLYPAADLCVKEDDPPGTMPAPAWAPLQQLQDHCEDIKVLNLTFPYGTLPEENKEVLRRAYYATVTYIDYELGRVLETLSDTDLDENTVIVVMGDHGFQLGELDLWEKFNIFDLSTRVPLYVVAPGITTPGRSESGQQKRFKAIKPQRKHAGAASTGRQSDALVEAVDVFPTLVDLCGLPAIVVCPELTSRDIITCTEGASMVPLMRTDPPPSWKSAVFSIYPRPSYYSQSNTNVMAFEEVSIMGYGMKTDNLRYNEWVSYNTNTRLPDWSDVNARELYFHQSDPGEEQNVADDPEHAELIQQLSQQLQAGWIGAYPVV